LYPIGYSAGNRCYISGPSQIIYNNLGTLDSASLFDTAYALFDGRTHSEIHYDDCFIEWGLINLSGVFEQDISEAEKLFYDKCMPQLSDDKRLIPAPLYVHNISGVPVVCMYKGLSENPELTNASYTLDTCDYLYI
jgi:hypothetical protein